MNFPDNSIKGIPNKEFLIDETTVGSHLFHFKQTRDDEFVEQSINWEDNEFVIDFTLNQRGKMATYSLTRELQCFLVLK